jgi:hypothetical protein
MLRIVLIVAVCLSACVFARAQESQTSPCDQARLKVSMLDAQLSAERARSDAERLQALTASLRAETSEKSLADHRAQSLIVLAGAKDELAGTKASTALRVANLEGKIAEMERLLAQKDVIIMGLTESRDAAIRASKRANKRTCAVAFLAAALGVLAGVR